MAEKKKGPVREFLETIIVAVALAAFVIVFIVQGFYIPSGSMEPTLMIGDRILVNKFLYRFEQPKRGDIIVFKFPPDESKILVKRLIATGGETVQIKDDVVYINGKALKEGYLKVQTLGDYGPVTVPKGMFFVLGDNRNNSDDSRYWGFVPRKNILGKAFVIYYPFNRVKILKDYQGYST